MDYFKQHIGKIKNECLHVFAYQCVVLDHLFSPQATHFAFAVVAFVPVFSSTFETTQ